MNRLNLIGRIVRDIELREVGDGRMVTNNTLAVTRTFKKEGGPDADFMNFVAWGKRAELLEEYCEKGDLVGLDGRIQSRSYINDKQERIFVVEMVVETVHFLQTRRNNNQNNNNQQNNQNNNQQNNYNNNDNNPQKNIQTIQTANGEQNL